MYIYVCTLCVSIYLYVHVCMYDVCMYQYYRAIMIPSIIVDNPGSVSTMLAAARAVI